MDLSAVANELYGAAPEEFVETRKRLAAEAKKAGDRDLAKRIGALRRPTASAWAINQLARSAPDELGWLSDVGADLRAAWAEGRHVGGLDQRRGEVIDLLGRTARALARQAGRPLRESAVREVEDTLHAATMDPEVADEVRSGRLTQPRSHVGFVPAGVPARPAGRPGVQDERPEPPERPVGERRRAAPAKHRTERDRTEADRTEADRTGVEADRERAETAARERLAARARAAAAEAREAADVLAARESEADVAERAHADLADEAERLRRRLDEVLERRDAAMEGLRTARRERDRAAGRAEE
ncbi:hypothetical protein, partial [Actinomadura sp. HBU206391]|uniref:hypothetical protein n=1 Tax=Actinomadura sp. HBU206391 TaxID=2731692 RepID=UPI00164F6FB3|nr:hypothetical protein [Actinomadura sp. HBU206391]